MNDRLGQRLCKNSILKIAQDKPQNSAHGELYCVPIAWIGLSHRMSSPNF
jgi:hypothetical protein